MTRIGDHLAERYGIDVIGVREIEPGGGVHRVDRTGGASWIARVFQAERTLDAVEGDSAILRHVATHEFPAERLAVEDAVSTMEEGLHVLVTTYVDGVNGRPDRGVELARTLGDLLGRLHTLPVPANARPAGGWHHLSQNGGSRMADVAILRERVQEQALLDALSALEDDAGLPTALVHPDLTSPNVTIPHDGAPVVIDWTGSGVGARVGALGVTLFGAGEPHLVDAVIDGYRSHVTLEPAELDHLPSAVWSFPLVLDAWMAMTYPGSGAGVVDALTAKRRACESIAAHAVERIRRG